MPIKPHRPVSLTLRITAIVGTVTTLVFLAFGWLIEHSIEQHFTEQDVDELRVVAESVQHALISTSSSGNLTLKERLDRAVSGHHGVYFYVADISGQTLHSMPGPDLATIAQKIAITPNINAGTLHTWQELQQTYRGSVLRVQRNNEIFTLAVAASMDFHLHFLQQFNHTLWTTTLIACVISIMASWLAVHQGHAPLRQISDRIRSIRSDQLHVRLKSELIPHELLVLANAFNDMLGRIQDSFQRLSDFSADIAHELRTPVTNLTTQTQVALSRSRSVEEYREILYSNLEEFERMSKMISDMLFLAQTDNKLLKPELIAVDIASEIRELFDYFEAWAEENGVSITLAGSHPVVLGDKLMLRRALSNLLSNAIRHTTTGNTVTVTLITESDSVQINIANPGVEIPEKHLAKLFERFYRIDASRQRTNDGAGLGLAIVKSIIDAHNGKVEASSINGVNVFTIRLPLTAVAVA